MNATPMSLDEEAAAHGGLEQFRLDAISEMTTVLKCFSEGKMLINLNAANGASVPVTLWSIDIDRDTLSFDIQAHHPLLQKLLNSNEATAVGYLENIKIQFDLEDLVLVHGQEHAVLTAAFPKEIFRFQRRNSYRVRPLLRHSPMARFRHPMMPDMQLSLRLVDISLGGCALLWPDNTPPFEPSITVNAVHVDLDSSTHFNANIKLLYVSAIDSQTQGIRLGCEWVQIAPETHKSLQLYIDQTQRRRRVMSVE